MELKIKNILTLNIYNIKLRQKKCVVTFTYLGIIIWIQNLYSARPAGMLIEIKLKMISH